MSHDNQLMAALKKIPVVRMRGEVVKGFGRGSKMLGVPTSDLNQMHFEMIFFISLHNNCRNVCALVLKCQHGNQRARDYRGNTRWNICWLVTDSRKGRRLQNCA